MKTGVIEHKKIFDCKAETLYWIIMNENIQSEATGAEAKIENFVGGQFSLLDGYASGETIGLIKYKIIIQNWKFNEESWPENHYTVCCFELIEHENQTTLNFHHKNVPEYLIDKLAKGWHDYFWEPIEHYLKNSARND